ncbi:Crp/Fnr family transcriptional regulator [Aquirufa sp. ROCK-SH2]
MNIFDRLASGTYGIKGLISSFILTLTELMYKNSYKKGDIILKEGEICDKIYYIESGLMRFYTVKDGKEISTWFSSEGDFITSANSFHFEIPCHENIQVLENSIIYSIDKSVYFQMIKMHNNFALFSTNELYFNLVECQNQCLLLRTLKAEDRYKFFISKYPDMKNRISQKYLSTFLGIDNSYLSKIIHKEEIS